MSDIVLQTINLTKRFGTFIAVDRLNLEVRAGEVFGFLGPNGAGKTTSINMMVGLLKPDDGEVRLHGQSLHVQRAARARVGVCPQNIVVWSTLTCLEQLEFIGEMYDVPRAESRRRGLVLLEALGLAEKRNQLARTLSGGMQRRLNLLMALVHEPDLLVLDEPEAGLDPQSRVLVREYIKTLARRKTIILTTHNMDEAERLADRVAIIDHGRIIAIDTPKNLKDSLGGDLVTIGSPDPAAVAGALNEPWVVRVETHNDNVVVSLKNADQYVSTMVTLLNTRHIPITSIAIHKPTLEDVFLSFTGKTIREQEADTKEQMRTYQRMMRR